MTCGCPSGREGTSLEHKVSLLLPASIDPVLLVEKQEQNRSIGRKASHKHTAPGQRASTLVPREQGRTSVLCARPRGKAGQPRTQGCQQEPRWCRAETQLYVIPFPQTQGTARRDLCRAAWKANSPALELCRIMFHSEPLAVWVAPALTLQDAGWAKRQHQKGLRSRAGEGCPPPNALILLLLKHIKEELSLLSLSRSLTVLLLLCQAKGMAKGFKRGAEARSISPHSHTPAAPR